ncbi:TIGR01212 family radical SAM protein [Oscillibacter sp.]|uniref:TIGR01212 family radical SAM protein n=1 Tax=Oscillibacter sp. TaxID=1945593 RepID=UPI0026354C6C|nr:TIGR01212 family radical SAM protein [Oscillibacter sp.]MDD3346248.1 TIGR01212 family radical SAM protein [Oscillibacter sp.]
MYWNSLSTFLKKEYGGKVYKLSLSSGCSCPNRDGTLDTRGCVFCDGSGAFAAQGDLPAQLTAAMARVAAKAGPSPRYIAYFQSFTNTYAPVDLLRTMYTAAMAPPEIVALSIATRPDCLPPEVLALLAELNRVKPVWVELGLQTIHPKTAAYLRRGYELPVYETAVRDLKAAGITVVVHQILGLPGESREMMAETARFIGRSGADGIKFHLLHVLRGTDLALDWSAGRFETMTQEAYIAALEACLQNIPREMVVHRLTGDGAKRDLLSPAWSGDKKRVLNAIHASLKQHDVEQGSALGL